MPKKASTSTAISTKSNTSLAAPSHIKQGHRGKEKLKAKDFTMPFLRLAQEKTPQVIAETLDAGVFFNSATNEVFGAEVDILILASVTGQMRFGQYNKKEGILCQAPDGVTALAMNGKDEKGKPTNKCENCVLAQWKDNEPPACMKQGRFMVLRPGTQEPMTLVLQSTNFNLTRKINSMLAGPYDSFAHVIKLGWAKGDKAPKITASRVGFASEEDYKNAESIYESAKSFFFGASSMDSSRADD